MLRVTRRFLTRTIWVAVLLVVVTVALAFPATSLTPVSRALPLSWGNLDGPDGGSAQAIALSPGFEFDRLVYAGGGRDFGRGSWAGWGIFRSDDAGRTWDTRSGPTNGAVLDFGFSPTWAADGVALAGLWQGLWRTTDAGGTWTQLTSLETGGPSMISAVAVSPSFAADHTMLAGGSYGSLWRSTNSGAAWSLVASTSSVRRIAYHGTDRTIALAGAADGLWRTTDGGATWGKITESTTIFDVAFQPKQATAYVTYSDHVWRSTDGGATWSQFGGLSAPFLDQLAVSPDGQGIFVTLGSTLYRYAPDLGAFKALPTSLAGRYIQRLAISPNYAADRTLLAGTLDGVWISTDGGSSFTRSRGFVPLTVTKMSADPSFSTSDELFTATEMGVWRRTGGAWQPANNGLGGVLAFSISDVVVSPNYPVDGTVFASQVSSVSIGASLFKSTDRGTTWVRKMNTAYIGQVALSPGYAADQTAFMVSDQKIKQSTDGGETWTLQPYWDYPHIARILALSPGFTTNQMLYVAGDTFYRTTDGGTSWSPAESPPPISEGAAIRWQPNRLAVGRARSGVNGDNLFLAINRYETDPPYGRHDQLWKSADGGNTWALMTSMPDVPVSALALGSDYPTRPEIFVATYDDSTFDDREYAPDLYYSPDDGATWQNLGALPTRSPMRSLLVPTGVPNVLLVGAGGVWQLDLRDAPTATPDPCRELLVNRGFEYEYGWRIPNTAYPAARTTEKHYQGSWSMRTGIVNPGENKYSFSDFSQDVSLPAVDHLPLNFWHWPQANVTGSAGAAALRPAENLAQLRTARTLEEFQALVSQTNGDLQYGMVIDPATGNIREFLFVGLADDRAWVNGRFDLAQYRGQTVRLQFGTRNDGYGPMASQWFDLFSVRACVSPIPTSTFTPTSTLTPTATATSPPTASATSTNTATPIPTAGTPTATLVVLPRIWLPLLLAMPTPSTPTPTASPTSIASATPTPTPTTTGASYSFSSKFPLYMLVQPTMPESLYVLDTSGRLLRSTDGGVIWRDLAVQSKLGWAGLSLGGAYNSPYPLWLGTEPGLYTSENGGDSWTQAGGQKTAVGVTVDFDSQDTLWSDGALDGSYVGVIRSTNRGADWGSAGTGITIGNRLAANILIDPSDHSALFAWTWNDRGVPSMWRGQSPGLWSAIASPTGGAPLLAPPLLGLAWNSADGTLWAGGAQGRLFTSPNPKEMTGSNVRWEEAASFGAGYYAQPLAWGSGPRLYITLHRLSPAAGAFLFTADGGQSWTQIVLP